MGHGHSHAHRDSAATATTRGARRILVGALLLVAVITVAGVVALWPDHSAVTALRDGAMKSAPGVTYPRAEVVALSGCEPAQSGPSEEARPCELTARLADGPEVTFPVPPQVADAGVRAGDAVRLMQVPGADQGRDNYSFWSVERHWPLGWLALGFVLVVAAVARMRGLRALAGLGLSAVIIVWFMLPALLTGESGIAVALVGSSAIMFSVLYLTHGLNLRTSAALAGTLVGVLITAGMGWWSVQATRLTGVSEEGGRILLSEAGSLDFQGLLICAVIIAGLGILNDVTITQSSSVWELRAAGPDLTRWQVFRSAMRIGRDHIASTIYTMTFAYTGAALTTLMLLVLYAQPALQLVSAEELAQEIVHTLVSGIGLVLAVPATTAIAALCLAPGRIEARHDTAS